MKITIITITYNSAKTIRDTLESVKSQKFNGELEYIVVDGASSDGTQDIIAEYKDVVTKFISESDKGIYDAMNKGIRMATGDVVGILNSDDIFYDENVLETIATTFKQQNCDSVFGNLQFVKENDLNTVVRIWKGSPYKKGAFLKGWHPAHPTFYVKRSIYEKYGLFDISLDVSADFELMLRFIEKYSITAFYVDCNIVKMRMGGESTGSISKIIQGNKNILRGFKKNNLKPYPFYTLRRLLPKVVSVIKNKIN